MNARTRVCAQQRERFDDVNLCVLNSDGAPRTTVINTAAIQAPPGKGCPRCGGVVFAAEQVLAKGREWHRKCYKCKDCTKTLDSIIACDGPDKDVYCKTCYGKKWGPHGYGFACGSGFLQTDGLTWVKYTLFYVVYRWQW